MMMKKPLRNKFLLLIFVCFFCFFLAYGYLYLKKIKSKVFIGTICAKEFEIFSLEAGKIKKIYVNENDLVKKNDLLVQFDTNLLDKKIQQIHAAIEYEGLRQNLLKIKEEKTLKEYLNLKKEKNCGLKEINSKLQLLESIQLLSSIQAKKISKLETELCLYNEKKKSFYIYSPCCGVVQNLGINSDQSIKDKEKLFTISDYENVWIEAKISNKEMAKYKIGNNCEIFIETFPESKFLGKIFNISNKPANSKFFDIKLSVNQLKKNPNEATHLLVNGMKANIKYE